MNTLLNLLSIFSSVILFLLTLVAIFTLRKPRKITMLGTLLSGVIAALSLLTVVVLGGMHLNLLLALPILLLGMLLGFVRGQMVKFSLLDKVIIGRNSIMLAVLWGTSLGVSLLLGLLGSTLVASLGLVPVVLSTGLQLGYAANLFLRQTAVLLGAGSSGISSMLNLGPYLLAQGSPPDSSPLTPEKNKRKGWVVGLVIVIVGACLLVTTLALLSTWWLMV